MRTLLVRRNQVRRQDLQALRRTLATASVPPELEPYRGCIVNLCDVMEALARNNLTFLSRREDDILEDVLSNTQQVVLYLRLLSSRLAIPILRASPADRLCLTVVGWLHREHPQTAAYPAATSDGAPAIWPFTTLAPIYFFPCVEQRRLLYLPLLFHEFGHLLYACHKPEMDDLVKELQRKISHMLVPLSQRNDRHAQDQAVRRQAIVDTWYSWTQEFFCDAVGLTIGGPAYLHAFSAYLNSLDRGEFHRQPADLYGSAHPVTWLRIKSLTVRAAAAGHTEQAQRIATEWDTVARALGVAEDYHGVYGQPLEEAVARSIDDMLIEAAPRACTDDEAAGEAWSPNLTRWCAS
jgi:hypothetical protein